MEICKGFALLGTCSPKPKRVRAFGEDSQRVRTFGHALAETLKGFAVWARIRKGFALLGTAMPNMHRGSHFRTFAPKGLRFSAFSGCGAKGSQLLGTSDTKQKPQAGQRNQIDSSGCLFVSEHNSSIAQPINQSNNQSINQSINQPMNQ